MQVVEVIRIRVHLKVGFTEVFGDDRVMYESNYVHHQIAEDRSQGIEVAGRLTVQGAKFCQEGGKGLFVCWEAAEGPFLEMCSASFVEVKSNSEMNGFGEGVGRRQKVGVFRQKGEVGID